MGGICASCFGSDEPSYSAQANSGQQQRYRSRVPEPSPETKRRLQAEAAEKRLRESESRGVRDPERVKRMQKRQEEVDKAMMSAPPQGQDGGLRWTTG